MVNKKMAALLVMHEEQIGKETKPEALVKGDLVAVATTLGRTVATGVVDALVSGVVVIELRATGIVQRQSFPVGLYRFFKLDREESANLAEEPGEVVDGVVSHPIEDVPGVNPPVDIIRQYIGGDVRWASTIWSDIGSYGFDRAMQKHGIDGAVVVDLKVALVSAGHIGG